MTASYPTLGPTRDPREPAKSQKAADPYHEVRRTRCPRDRDDPGRGHRPPDPGCRAAARASGRTPHPPLQVGGAKGPQPPRAGHPCRASPGTGGTDRRHDRVHLPGGRTPRVLPLRRCCGRSGGSGHLLRRTPEGHRAGVAGDRYRHPHPLGNRRAVHRRAHFHPDNRLPRPGRRTPQTIDVELSEILAHNGPQFLSWQFTDDAAALSLDTNPRRAPPGSPDYNAVCERLQGTVLGGSSTGPPSTAAAPHYRSYSHTRGSSCHPNP